MWYVFFQVVDIMKCAEKPAFRPELLKSDEKIPVIITAAGNSSRMKGINKIFSPLCGIPVIARTMLAFENCDCISEITVVCKEEDKPEIGRLAEFYSVSKLTSLVTGGSNRQQSVKNGAESLKQKPTKVLIHDGARPLVTDEVIRNVTAAARLYDSVACAVRPKDTVKVAECGVSSKTLDRDKLFLIQTPQSVNLEKYLEILSSFDDLSRFTDDTSIMEYGGIPTFMAEGDYSNIKITTKEDLIIAEAYIESR